MLLKEYFYISGGACGFTAIVAILKLKIKRFPFVVIFDNNKYLVLYLTQLKGSKDNNLINREAARCKTD